MGVNRVFCSFKKTNIIQEVKQMKSLFCPKRCWYISEESFTHSYVHHISRKVGTSWRGQRPEPQECYFKHNFHWNDEDNGFARSREERVEERRANHPTATRVILAKGEEVSAVNRFSLAGRANALTPRDLRLQQIACKKYGLKDTTHLSTTLSGELELHS